MVTYQIDATSSVPFGISAITYQIGAVTDPGPLPPLQKEEPEMRRQDFSFPYTGKQIAKAIKVKTDELDAQLTAVELVDDTTLEALGAELADRAVASKKDRIKSLGRSITKWEQEFRAYTQAANHVFDLDLEDVAHFGL